MRIMLNYELRDGARRIDADMALPPGAYDGTRPDSDHADKLNRVYRIAGQKMRNPEFRRTKPPGFEVVGDCFCQVIGVWNDDFPAADVIIPVRRITGIGPENITLGYAFSGYHEFLAKVMREIVRCICNYERGRHDKVTVMVPRRWDGEKHFQTIPIPDWFEIPAIPNS